MLIITFSHCKPLLVTEDLKSHCHRNRPKFQAPGPGEMVSVLNSQIEPRNTLVINSSLASLHLIAITLFPRAKHIFVGEMTVSRKHCNHEPHLSGL